MPEITRLGFDDVFADRIVVSALEHIDRGSNRHRILPDEFTDLSKAQPFARVVVQCAEPRIAERLLRDSPQALWAVEGDVRLPMWNHVDFSHFDIGKSMMWNQIERSTPWWEVKEWMRDSLVGDARVLITNRIKRFSFADDGDYALFRLMWG